MKPTILIAENSATLCDEYKNYLTQRGFIIETVNDGLNCVRHLRQNKPEVLVLDLQLQWGCADGVLQLMREESLLSAIPVILTHSTGFIRSKMPYFEPPVVRHLPKSFTPFDLFELIWQVIVAVHRVSQPTVVNRKMQNL